MTTRMQRREFITLFGGAAGWPYSAGAQQDRFRRIGWLVGGTESDRDRQDAIAILRESLAALGWVEGRNLRIDLRFGTNRDELARNGRELISLIPDLIVTNGGAATRTMQQLTQTIPIVFSGGGDPGANGLVQNISRPEANITGFSNSEPSLESKRFTLLKEAAPNLDRIAIVFVPELAVTAPSYFRVIESAAAAMGMSTVRIPVQNAVGVVRALDALAAVPNGGLHVLPPPPPTAIRDAIIQLAAQHRLPASYFTRAEAVVGGLLSYGRAALEQYRGAAAYVDRLLRGAKVSDLPVQFPTKYELVINLKTARAMGLTIPQTFLLRADEVIE
jgi:putative ABC transport system substrate-binding protein